MRIDAALDGRYRNALLAPFVGADYRQQFAQGNDGILVCRAIGFQAGRPDVLGTAQRHAVVGVQRHQQQAKQGSPPPLIEAMLREGLGRRRRFPLATQARLTLGPPAQGLQQIAGILPVATPEHGDAFPGMAIGDIGPQPIVGDDPPDDAAEWPLEAPARRVLGAPRPVNLGYEVELSGIVGEKPRDIDPGHAGSFSGYTHAYSAALPRKPGVQFDDQTSAASLNQR